MPTTMIAADVVEAAITKLEERLAAGPTTYTVKAAIAKVLPQVRRMVGSGWSYESIATALSEAGIPVKASTLRGYLAELEKDASTSGATEAPPPAKPAARKAAARTARASRPPVAAKPVTPPPSAHAGFDEDA